MLYSRMFKEQMLFAKEGSGGGGGKGRSEDDDDRDDDKPRRRDPVVTAAKYNSDVTAMAVQIGQLEDDNYDLRSKNRKLRGDIEGLNPSEGSVVLTKEQVADWEAYKALGKPKELETMKSENVRLATEQELHKRETLLREVAGNVAPGLVFDYETLKDLDSRLSGVSYEKKTSKDETGQSVTRWVVKYKEGDGDKAVSKEADVKEYFEAKFPRYMPVLISQKQDDALGTPYPEQLFGDQKLPAGGQTDKDAANLVGNYMNDNYSHVMPEKQTK